MRAIFDRTTTLLSTGGRLSPFNFSKKTVHPSEPIRMIRETISNFCKFSTKDFTSEIRNFDSKIRKFPKKIPPPNFFEKVEVETLKIRKNAITTIPSTKIRNSNYKVFKNL